MNYSDIVYEKKDGIARVVMNRPDKLNAFRTRTVIEMADAFEDIFRDPSIGVAVLRGNGDRAFSVGGDAGDPADAAAGYDADLIIYLRKVHDLIRRVPVPVIAAVNGYAIGGGHVLHLVCDLSIAADHALFGQAGPKVGSFDAGYGAAYLTRVVGEKKAREIWFLCERYSAEEALRMGLVNKVVPKGELDRETEAWCRKILAMSPTAIRMLKAALNRESDHIAGTEAMSFTAADLYYRTEEAREGRSAYLEKRPPEFNRFRR
ncbi:MAG: enoyl-CoA hydratase-related protein [Syntrophales bacterium]|jgi:naphthoate synthase|nr:enoyl-CoA hydratase-related protein [Syntrophales bacterium]MCK9528359.1 enoyl-CoA hydratase-related protein [Syntrophales bacterium]MDX9922716.1 enoyl-CoA hydratase-related protein [Syntrophales bacterium]